eukprot:gene2105-3055_t
MSGLPSCPFKVTFGALLHFAQVASDGDNPAVVLSWGDPDPRPAFYSVQSPYPVGYVVQRSWRSYVRIGNATMYICKIESSAVGDHPAFVVTADDDPEDPIQAVST